MNTLTHSLQPFGFLLGIDRISKKDFLKMVHRSASVSQLQLVNFLEMIQFTEAYKKGNEIILE